jgi:c-di-GMP-binding flagellar brake protein YcgR
LRSREAFLKSCAQDGARLLVHAVDNYISEIFNNNRRREIRRKVRLPASVSPGASVRTAESAGQWPLSVLGHTRDISASGLALVMPSMLAEDFANRGDTLRIILALPAGDVEMRCEVVRHNRLGESEPDAASLIGMSITEMSDDDRDLYLEYLRTLGAE